MPDMNMQIVEEVGRHQLVTEFDVQSQSELTDYQVQLENVGNPTQAQDNLVVGVDGESLSHWNESLDFDTWVEIDIATSGKRGLLIHGNDGLRSENSGDDTFIQYHGDTTSIFTDTPIQVPPLIVNGRFSWTPPISTQNTFWGVVGSGGFADEAADINHRINTEIFRSVTFNETSASGTTVIGAASSDSVYEIVLNGTNAKFYRDGTLHSTHSDATVPTGDLLGLFWGAKNVGDARLHWSFIRKYTAIEPSVQIGTPKNISTALKSFGRAG